MCPRPHREDLDRTQPQGAGPSQKSPACLVPPNPACVQGVSAHWGASLPTPLPQAIVFSILDRSSDLGLYESAAPTSPTRNLQGLENPLLCLAFSSLAQVSLDPSSLASHPSDSFACPKDWVPLGGSRAPAQPEIGWKGGNLGSISPLTLKSQMALLGKLGTCCMGPGHCQLMHPMIHPGSWSGWGWDQLALGFLAQLSPSSFPGEQGSWGREPGGPGSLVTLPAAHLGSWASFLLYERGPFTPAQPPQGSLSGSNDTEAEEMLRKSCNAMWLRRLCRSDSPVTSVSSGSFHSPCYRGTMVQW